MFLSAAVAEMVVVRCLFLANRVSDRCRVGKLFRFKVFVEKLVSVCVQNTRGHNCSVQLATSA